MAGPVQAVERAMTVLEVFAADPRPLSIDQVAAKAGLPRATAHRLIHTLQSGHYLQPAGKKFRLGHSVLGLGFGRLHAAGLNRSAQPILDALTNHTNETAILVTAHPARGESQQSTIGGTGHSNIFKTSQAAENQPNQPAAKTISLSSKDATDPQTFIVAAVAHAHQTLTVAIEREQELDPDSALVAPLRLSRQVNSVFASTPTVGFHDQARSVRVIALEVKPWPTQPRVALTIATPASRWTEAQLLDQFCETLKTHARLLGG